VDPLLFFSLNLGAAALLGAAIGLERQWNQNPAGLRTCMLVSMGACLFVSLTILMDDTQSPTRIASYIVSGVGFLGGGVILKEGINVRGLNTAATMWCCAAVGTLSGAGFPWHAMLGAGSILAVHLCLRPITRRIDARALASPHAETFYRIRVVCESRQEALCRSILLRHINSHPDLTTQGITTHGTGKAGQAEVDADVLAKGAQDRAMQELVERLNIEPGVQTVSWHKATRNE
jgi:putative Mg2+ transporter-C (MgtC) family protein